LKNRRDVTFLCVGDGDDSAMRALVPTELSKNILFLGRQNKVESIMNICDIGVLATDVKYHAEGISNALMEFMALSKPVMATNYGGSVELVIDGETGYLINAYDHQQLAARIGELLSNDSKRVALGAASKARVETEFSIDKMIASFYHEYKTLTESVMVS
jgi:glycosyltransferase involved in cell wall biosynthesis